MKFDISKFDDVEQESGRRKVATLSLSKHRYIRINKYFIIKNELEKERFVKIKALKENNNLIIALNFLENKEGSEKVFSLSYYENGKRGIKSFSFSARSIFLKYDIDYKSIKLNYSTQEHEGIKYFVVEIPLK